MNMLKCYYECEPSMPVGVVEHLSETPSKFSCGTNLPLQSVDKGGNVVPMNLSNSDVLANVDTELQHLSYEQRASIKGPFYEFGSICSDPSQLTA